MSTYDIKAYRKAIVYLRDIKQILILIWQVRKLLEPYAHYISVAAILLEMRKQENMLNLHLMKYNTVVQTKGRMPPGAEP